jgi:predicted RNase H-like HicB family nuclease
MKSFTRALIRALGCDERPPSAFNVRVYREDGGGFWATIEEMPGCFASGDDLPETLAALSGAAMLYLEPSGLSSGGRT